LNSRLSGSEAALATLACKKIEATASPDLLIGGLGMGFTLRASTCRARSASTDRGGRIGARGGCLGAGPMAALFGDSLSDPRASIREIDVAELIKTSSLAFDAILLDVDNGPEGFTRKANDALYNRFGLQAARAALRPGGVLAVWSSGPSQSFSKRLLDAGFEVNKIRVRATGKGGGAHHVIWIATKN